MSKVSVGELQLVVRDLVPEDMANYTCKSSNNGGYHERNGTITVQCKHRLDYEIRCNLMRLDIIR